MFNKLILCKGGTLISEEKRYNETTQEWEDFSRNLTDKAHSFLHHKISFDGCRIGDIYALLRKDPILVQVFRENFTESFVKHLEGKDWDALESQFNAKSEKGEGFQKVMVERRVSFDENKQSLSFNNSYHVFGLSHPLKNKTRDYKVGQQVPYSLLGCKVEDILFVPIEYNPAVKAFDHTNRVMGSRKNFVEFLMEGITLNELIFAITYELSYWGTPAKADEENQKLAEMNKEIKEILNKKPGLVQNLMKDVGKEQNSSKESVNLGDSEDKVTDEMGFNVDFDAMILSQDVCYSIGFKKLPEISKEALQEVIEMAPGTANIENFVSIAFGNKAVLNKEYAHLTVFEYRYVTKTQVFHRFHEKKDVAVTDVKIWNQLDANLRKIVNSFENPLFPKDTEKSIANIAKKLRKLGFVIPLRALKKALSE